MTEAQSILDCCICMDPTSSEDWVVLPCRPKAHAYHAHCIMQSLEMNRQCPMCRSPCTPAQMLRICTTTPTPNPPASDASSRPAPPTPTPPPQPAAVDTTSPPGPPRTESKIEQMAIDEAIALSMLDLDVNSPSPEPSPRWQPPRARTTSPPPRAARTRTPSPSPSPPRARTPSPQRAASYDDELLQLETELATLLSLHTSTPTTPPERGRSFASKVWKNLTSFGRR